ncbi:MAG: recombination mediator RecR [Treponema sp.]|jgi:recombination protein RecR|nr:recombination mediator RecR [Treponema sp.]
MNPIDRLVVLLTKLPGIGKKSARRMVYHLLRGDPAYAQGLAEAIAGLHKAITRCRICGSFTEEDPCPRCSDTSRDAIICVVERAQDVPIIEESQVFQGRFHVLGGLIAPLEGVNPGDLAIPQLLNRVREEHIQEVILALNPTVEGDTTALYVQHLLKEYRVDVTRLASGLPVGGDLEYTDRLTLSRSFRGRIKFSFSE